MQWSDDHGRYEFLLRGTIAINDDLTDVQSLSDGGELTIRDDSGGVSRRVEIHASGGQLTRTYYVGGVSRGWTDEGRKFLAEQLPPLVRRSGLGADSRVKSILEKKGVPGVLAEIDLLGGDYARRLYFTALLDQSHFDTASIQPILQAIARRMTSDYDRRVTLEKVAHAVKLDRKGVDAYVRALETMKSDYDRRVALTTLFGTGGQIVDGDTLITAVGQMRSAYDRRQVLADLMARGPLDTGTRTALLNVTAGIRSDYDRAETLNVFVARFGVDSPVREPFFAGVAAIGSAYDRRRVLTRLLKTGPLASDVRESALKSLDTMGSDYDRAETLIAFLNTQAPLDSSSRQAFVAAAERIRSSYDQNRVLAALAKTERR